MVPAKSVTRLTRVLETFTETISLPVHTSRGFVTSVCEISLIVVFFIICLSYDAELDRRKASIRRFPKLFLHSTQFYDTFFKI